MSAVKKKNFPSKQLFNAERTLLTLNGSIEISMFYAYTSLLKSSIYRCNIEHDV